MSRNFTVVFDANVIYSKYLRDLLVRLALAGLFRAKWTTKILDEMVESILENRPDLKRGQLDRVCQLMNEHVRDCLVTGYEPLIDILDLPDPDDRHVLAAAIRCNAAIILTFNLKDFPKDTLDDYHITALHPDDFIINQIDLDSARVCTVIREMREGYSKPTLSAVQLLEVFTRNGLARTADALSTYSKIL